MKHVRVIIAVMMLFVLASCGSEESTSTAQTEQRTTASIAEAEPTAQPTDELVAEESTAEATAESVAVVASDEIVQLIADANPANGEALYNEMNTTGFSCATCHNAGNEDRLIGPGLLHIPSRATTRVEGQVAERYLYDSIVHPNDYLVQDTFSYSAGLMPQTYANVYSEEELYDIVAYLMTLGDASVVAQVEATPEPEVVVEYSAEDARTQRLLAVGNVDFGATAFDHPLIDDASCSDCHATTNANEGADGPGLAGVAQNLADSNVETPPNVIVYNAILNAEAHGDLYIRFVDENSFLDLANIVAYLMTLELDESQVVTDATSTGDESAETSEETVGLSAEQQAIVDSVLAADATHGEEVFNAINGSGFACSNCHNAGNEDRLIGPGLLNIQTHAETRVEGEPAIIYIYHSIIEPNAYIVEGGYPEGLMPQNYSDIFTDAEIYDVIAYLLTLGE